MPDNLPQQLKQVLQQIKDRYRPQKIICFGSIVSGKTHRWSDADIIIIKNTPKRFFDRIQEVSSLIDHIIPLDLLVYTPKEFQEMSEWNHFIKNEVIKKGQLVYET